MGEGSVPQPVDVSAVALALLAQRDVTPYGAEQSHGHTDEDDQAPVEGDQQTTDDGSDEGTAEGGVLVDARREAALVARKALVQIANELDINIVAPSAWKSRMMISQRPAA